MSDPIKNDDAKFRDLLVKQHPTLDSFVGSLPKSEDVIENDDNKMDDLLLLQSIASADEIEHKSIEEKYEDEIMIDEVNKQIERDIAQSGDSIWVYEDEDYIEIEFDDDF